MGPYFLITQYLLSRGNPQAVRKDWPLMLAMNFMPLCAVVLTFILEPDKARGREMLWVAILALACSYAGAVLAARTARR